MTAFGGPLDPTTPRDPVVVPRERPPAVGLAGFLLFVAGGLGMLAAVALFVAAGGVVDAFRSQSLRVGVGAAEADAVATALRTVLVSSSFGAAVLGLLSLFLGRGVLRRQEAARVGALVVAAGSIGCAMVRTSVTAFGKNVNWTVAADDGGVALTNQVAQAFGDAMPSWLVGLGGGLTDLQSLGYIAVAALLLAPRSLEYFRTRIVSAPPPPDPLE